MIRKYADRKYLENIPVLIEDTSEFSLNYFNVITCPKVFQAGKNLIRLQGSQNLLVNTPVLVEILDFNNNPIYYEIPNIVEEDGSRIISVWIYPDTPPGNTKITIVGIARVDQSGNQLSEKDISAYNIRWTKKLSTNTNTKNSSEIIFQSEPIVSITEAKSAVFTKSYISGSSFATASFTNLQYKFSNNTAILESISGSTVTWSGSNALALTGGKLVVYPNNIINTTPLPTFALYTESFQSSTGERITSPEIIPYTAFLDKIIGNYAILSTPYKVQGQLGKHIYDNALLVSGTIEYYQLPTITPVTASQLIGGGDVTSSIGVLSIKNIDNITGDVNRINVYARKSSTPSTVRPFRGYDTPASYIKIADTVVQPREVLMAPNLPILDIPISYVINYWTGSKSQGMENSIHFAIESVVVPLTNAIAPDKTPTGANIDSFANNKYFIIETKDYYNLQKDTIYQLQIDAVVEDITGYDAGLGYQLVDIVLSGSACVDTHLNLSNVKYIGSIKNTDGYLYLDQTFDFTVPFNGDAKLMFLLRSGKWYFSDISIKPKQDLGFTPNTLEVLVPIEGQYVSDKYDLKIEYVDYLGNRSKTVSEVKEFNIGATPLILNQVFADTVVSNTQYASASIVTGSLQVTGSVYYQNRKQYNFGQFYDTTTQSGSRNTPYAMKLNTTDISEGVSITNNGSGLPTRITVSNTGYYNLQFSSQLYNTANTNLLFTIWFRNNGIDVANSATNVEVVKGSGVNGQLVAAWNYLTYLTSSQYVEIMWSYDDGGNTGQLLYLPSSSLVPFPAVPSVIATMTQVA